MGFFQEFKQFAVKGNVVDMAVGIVIGAAFGKIVSSFVADLIMPVVGQLTGGVDLKKYKVVMKEASVAANGDAIPEVAMSIGNFASITLDFVIVAFAIFFVIRAMSKLKKKEAAAPPPAPPKPTNEEVLLAEIRDLLKKRA